jgi:protease I
MRITRHFFEKNKPVASVCHGIEIPAAADCLRGRTATTVAKCALDITMVGGKYVDQPVVTDGNFVSARVWADNTEFLREFIRVLKAAQSK